MIPYDPGRPRAVAEIRAFDAFALERLGIPGLILMENAGRNAAEIIFGLLKSPARDRVVILCGPGNNGGDGFVIARHLANAGVPLAVLLATPRQRYRGDAAVNLAVIERLGLTLIDAAAPAAAAASGGRPSPASPERSAIPSLSAPVLAAISSAAVIVDALLGTGSTGPPRSPMDSLIRAANERQGARRVAIDIPSGLDADSGAVFEPCFRADVTITLLARKIGFDAAAAKGVLGNVLVAGIGAALESGRRDPATGRAPRV